MIQFFNVALTLVLPVYLTKLHLPSNTLTSRLRIQLLMLVVLWRFYKQLIIVLLLPILCTIDDIFVLSWLKILRWEDLRFLVLHESRSIREDSWLTLVNIAYWIIFAFWSIGIVINERGINFSKLSVWFNFNTLLTKNNPTLSFRCFQIYILWIMHNLFLDRNIFIPFNLPLHWHHLNLLLRNYLFKILNPLLNCIIVLLYHLTRNRLHYSLLFILNHLPLDRNLFNKCTILIFNHLLLVWHVIHSTLS